MKKKIFNPIIKFVYSSIARDANKICTNEPPESAAHFVSFYFLMVCAKSKKISVNGFQSLLYSINKDLTLNYSVFGIFGSHDDCAREQTAMSLSKHYEGYGGFSTREENLDFRNKIALEYSKAMNCSLSFQSLGSINSTFFLEKVPQLGFHQKNFVILSMVESFGGEGQDKILKFTPL